MIKILMQYTFGTLLQSIVCVILYVCIYNFFANIDRKIRPQGINSSDIIREMKIGAIIILLTAIVLLSLSIIINIFYKPLLGFYLVSLFLLYLGKNAIFPSKGRKITENCWVAPFEGRNFIVTLNDHTILIKGDWVRGKPEHIIYKEVLPKWLPPHENEFLSEADYEYIFKAILKYLEKHRKIGLIE